MQSQPELRAAIYCRISETDERVDKVEIQEKSCRSHAKKNGYSVVQVYADDGISAYSGKLRPDFEQLLADAGAGKFDVIVATFEDRLTRQTKEKMALAWACADNGIVWHTVHEGLIDPSNEDDEMLSYLRGWVGKREQTHKRKRQRERFEERRAQGLPLWGVRPFGFEQDRIQHREDEAEQLRWAYDVILGGGSIYSVIKAWNERGVMTSRGKTWSYATVQQMLKRPRNAGLMERDGEPVYDQKAAWQPIVPLEVWSEVRSLLTDSSRAGSVNREPRWLCAGIVLCGVCGSVMRSATGKDRRGRFPIYRCARNRTTATTDDRRHVAVKCEELDALVRDAIVSAFMLGPTAVTAEDAVAVEELRRLRLRLTEVRRAMADATELVGEPGVKVATIKRKLAELDAEERGLVAQVEESERRSAHAAMLVQSQAAFLRGLGKGKRVSLAQAAGLKAQLEERFDSLPLAQRRTLVRSMLKITVYPGRDARRIDVQSLKATSFSSVAE